MKTSHDGLIEIDIASNIHDAVLPPADFSIMNLPEEESGTNKLFASLYNTAVSRHVCLMLCRNKRKNRVGAVSNIIKSEKYWNYLETVSISYEKPSSCSNNGFLPLAEVGFVLYKGEIPDTKKTAWFGLDGETNASNMWGLACQPDELNNYTYYQTFSWELALLMKSLSGVLETRRFIYGHEVNQDEMRNIHAFCKKFQLKCRVYAKNINESNKLMQAIEVNK